MTLYSYSIPHPTDRYAAPIILKFTGTAAEFQRAVEGLDFKVVSAIPMPTHPA